MVPLVEAILEMEPLGTIFFGSTLLLLLMVIILLIYLSILTPLLSRRLDERIFTQRWFSVFELGFYTSWPFSLMKTLYYVGFISFPWLRRKRFKDIPVDLGIPKYLAIASRFYMALHLFALLLGIIFFTVGGYVYFFE